MAASGRNTSKVKKSRHTSEALSVALQMTGQENWVTTKQWWTPNRLFELLSSAVTEVNAMLVYKHFRKDEVDGMLGFKKMKNRLEGRRD